MCCFFELPVDLLVSHGKEKIVKKGSTSKNHLSEKTPSYESTAYASDFGKN
jgi:hypothetical protein